jgi:hypothetical protein
MQEGSESPGDLSQTAKVKAWNADPARYADDIGVHLDAWEKRILREAMGGRMPVERRDKRKLERVRSRIERRLQTLSKD